MSDQPAAAPSAPLQTPDGRYIVVRGRLWRRADPSLPEARRQALVGELMAARRDKGAAMKRGDPEGREAARARVERAKQALGERGPVWWDDGAPDLNRHLVRTTPYAGWFDGLAHESSNGSNAPENGT
ncbi:hypothetical protein [Rhizosaccharibacter radicis]|uniref:Biopolymer transporter Tol n=1 Tax=Rhizosaccharibacter radicis TaxID=2782605 RepID=A0ABT1W0B0_9PROT|nr:hypothetical protein [Acetobacteraceae bacterium KSS12]